MAIEDHQNCQPPISSMSGEESCCQGLPDLGNSGVENLSNIFKTLGDEGRLRLCLCCFQNPCSVSELSEATGQSQSLTSHNLRHLRDARILVSKKVGRQVHYELADDHIRHVIADMAHHVLEDHD
ncbi:ArsR/SmtB family transcription factor [Kiloniella majae]|uniref:ArsR/SmtB family transcription factor n=1 Tax=Kiloniella majae TaxID=1938558 RepID=UPI001C3F8764|nr:metalloregulator ArsR/SmtB family transcription factor [Kiloniella majae]